jgi:uncharacterized protein
MAVTAYLETARVLRMDSAREFALRTLNRLLNEAWDGGATLHHVIAYPDGFDSTRQRRVPGTLDDYAFTVHACIDAWLASGKMKYFTGGREAGRCHDRALLRRTAGAFYDTPGPPAGAPLGALAARRKPLQDRPRRPAIPPRPRRCCASRR